MGKIKSIMNKLFYPNTATNDRYVRYLKNVGVKIGEGTRFVNPKKTNIDIGRSFYIEIGNNCCFSSGVTVLAHDYSWYVFVEKYNDILPDPGHKVIIGNNVFIGCNVTILPGVIIGDNVIIGAGSVVTKSIESNVVFAGNPAKKIKDLDMLYEQKKIEHLNDLNSRISILKENNIADKNALGFFLFDLLERTNENYDNYISKLEFNGIYDSFKIKKLFFDSKPSKCDFPKEEEKYE